MVQKVTQRLIVASGYRTVITKVTFEPDRKFSSSQEAGEKAGKARQTGRMKPSFERSWSGHTQGRPAEGPPTPADEQIDDEVSVLREDEHQQGVEVQTLHQ